MKWRYVGMMIAIAFVIALILFPHEVYDKFIWKYFIGPIVADAEGHAVSYHGVWAYEGYSLASEIAYGLFIVFFIYLFYLFFEKYNVKVNLRFIIASLPFILYGSVARVLEDAGVFVKPLSYLFISPIIYVQIGILFFISLIYGIRFHDGKTFAYSLILKNIAYVLVYIFVFIKYCRYNLHPVIFAFFSILSFLIYHKFRNKDYNASIFSFGILFLLTSASMLAYYSIGKNMDLRITIAPALAAIITLAIYFLSRRFNLKLLGNKLNNMLIFGHMLDGLTTYFAVVDPLHFGIGYGEKHPLPDFLMKKFYGIGYPLLKFFVIIGIIYVIDDLKTNLKNTIKFFILFLGLSPGLRDLLRIIVGA
ncbi:hypothetical protein B6U81_05170 [Thermoplasmatales archaeon ex4484_30]|nr:MAG: DUF63 family protein [Thermoplasmata archaeon]OYT60105.1 MAG: hypothetical protein B6U81_05170 [Thermoplasmatales archaeon ex4484_30]